MRARCFVVALLVPAIAIGQDDRDDRDDRDDHEDIWSSLALEAFGGIGNYGDFLEQHFEGGQRELRIDLGFAFGGTIALNPVEDTMFRLGYTASGGELSFDDDTGTDTDLRDIDDLDWLFAHVIGIEALRYLWNQDRRIVPYAVAGFTGTIWALNDAENGRKDRIVQPGHSSALFRFGASAGLGLQYNATEDLGIRAEWNNLGLGNPFDGNNAYIVTSGTTFSEPEAVRLGRITLGVVWHVNGD